jgi:hypothetical protein
MQKTNLKARFFLFRVSVLFIREQQNGLGRLKINLLLVAELKYCDDDSV